MPGSDVKSPCKLMWLTGACWYGTTSDSGSLPDNAQLGRGLSLCELGSNTNLAAEASHSRPVPGALYL